MNIYKVSRTNKIDYNSYDSFIVVSADQFKAANYAPEGGLIQWDESIDMHWTHNTNNIRVEYIGIASEYYDEGDIILKSFNAG